MGLFNIFGFGSRSRMDDDLTIAPGAKDGKIYKLLQLLSISVFLGVAVLMIFEVFKILPINATANGFIISAGVIGLGGMTALPWVRVFESFKNEKPFRITAIVFIAIIGACVVLWIICVWLIVSLIKNIDTKSLTYVTNSLNAIRVTIIASLQLVIASNITMNVVKYRKTLLPYQIMSAVAKLFIDVWFTLAFLAFSIDSNGEFVINSTANIFTNRWMWAFLTIAFVLTVFPSYIFRRADRKRMLNARNENLKEDLKEMLGVEDKNTSDTIKPASDNAGGESVEEKLRKIKTLLDNDLITQEEYDAKRADILNSI